MIRLLKWVLKKVTALALVVAFFVVGFFGIQGYMMYRSALEEKSVAQVMEAISQKEHYVTLEELPKTYIAAVVAVEDHRFYQHKGIDWRSVGRAVFRNLMEKGATEGGSSITQQLAKNQFFTQKKELSRKFAEVFMVREIEQQYSKQKILEAYINSIYYGKGYYCVYDASMGYFGKEPKDMNDYECTLLAGIPNAPSVYAPTANPGLAAQRQKQVVKTMVKWGYLTEMEGKQILG